MCCMAFLFSYESKEICCQYKGFSLTGNHKTKGVTETELLPPPGKDALSCTLASYSSVIQ